MGGQSKLHHPSALVAVGMRWGIDLERQYYKVFDLGYTFEKRW
jgi:hypothetical protein